MAARSDDPLRRLEPNLGPKAWRQSSRTARPSTLAATSPSCGWGAEASSSSAGGSLPGRAQRARRSTDSTAIAAPICSTTSTPAAWAASARWARGRSLDAVAQPAGLLAARLQPARRGRSARTLGGQAYALALPVRVADAVEADNCGGRAEEQLSTSPVGRQAIQARRRLDRDTVERSSGALDKELAIPIHRWLPLPWVPRRRPCGCRCGAGPRSQ